jgi:transposase
MSTVDNRETVLAAKSEAILPHLDERQRRLLLGAEARSIGRGGIRLVARAAGVREATVSLGVSDLDAGGAPLGRVRRVGGGRKRVVDVDPGLREAVLELVEPDVRGDPMSPLRWTTKSTRNLAAEVTRQGHRVSADTIGDLLREEGFSLQGNAKTLEGRQHPDRDAQFRHINDQVRAFRDAGDPVISVDCKKKELIGPFKNAGRTWSPTGDPVAVSTHDFPDRDLGKAVPYGIYDLAGNTGWVNVGTDHDTAAFAVASIRRWWDNAGRTGYPQARRLLITADAGGSNNYRARAWKAAIAALAGEIGIPISICHLPPGTSKWNKIEHRLFCHITMNWRGQPLTSHDIMIQAITATTTRTGLRVSAQLDTGTYPTGIEISDQIMAALPITRDDFHGDWNYTLHPTTAALSLERIEPPPHVAAGMDRDILRHSALTGMSRDQLHDLTGRLADAQTLQRERGRRDRRGGDRRRATGAGAHPKLEPADRILATILYQSKAFTQALLAELLGVDRSQITRAVTETRQLLDQHGHTTPTTTARFHTPTDVTTFIAHADDHQTTKIKTTC